MGYGAASMLDWVGMGALIALCSTGLGLASRPLDLASRISFHLITAAGLGVMGVGVYQLCRA